MAKTIKAVFGVGECTKVCPQWQYDYNTVLQFVGLELPANYEVDLSNSKTGQSTTVLGDENGCIIPAQYFIPGSSIFAWVFVTGSDYGFTRAQVEIPISPRAQHTGDPPTPEQQDALDAAIALLNETAEGIPTAIDSALAEAKASGEFDGADGNSIWYTQSAILDDGTRLLTPRRNLTGREGTPSVGDLVIGSEPGESRKPTYLYRIIDDYGPYSVLEAIGSIKGDTGAAGVDGQDGQDGAPGPQGPAGQDGQDGAQGPAGADGNCIWYTTVTIGSYQDKYQVPRRYLEGREGIPTAGDLVIGSEPGESGAPTYLYCIVGDNGPNAVMDGVGSLKGADGADGAPGPAGADGQDGQDGAPGADGEDGNRIWWTDHSIAQSGSTISINRDYLNGPVEPTKDSVNVGDLIVGPEADSYDLTITTLYVISNFITKMCILTRLCSIKGDAGADGADGADGYSPVVTITQISGGHRVTITDEDHPQGQSFDVMDGTGSSITVDSALSDSSENPVQNKVIKAALDNKGTYSKPSGGIPKTDLASDVQTSLGKADTALQTAPVTSVNGQTGAVSLPIPSTASDVGAVAVAQGVAHAGEFVVVGSDGNITTVSVPVYNGGSY